MYLVAGGELVEELVPVLLVVVDAEVPTNIQVQQEPVGATHPELVIGVWEGERNSAPPHTSAPPGEPNLHWSTGAATKPPLPAWAGRTVPESLVSQYLFSEPVFVFQLMGTIQV